MLSFLLKQEAVNIYTKESANCSHFFFADQFDGSLVFIGHAITDLLGRPTSLVNEGKFNALGFIAFFTASELICKFRDFSSLRYRCSQEVNQNTSSDMTQCLRSTRQTIGLVWFFFIWFIWLLAKKVCTSRLVS